jgi:hypothetical protein
VHKSRLPKSLYIPHIVLQIIQFNIIKMYCYWILCTMDISLGLNNLKSYASFFIFFYYIFSLYFITYYVQLTINLCIIFTNSPYTAPIFTLSYGSIIILHYLHLDFNKMHNTCMYSFSINFLVNVFDALPPTSK